MSKKIDVGGVIIGGGQRIKIQSMTTFRPSDFKNTISQIKRLEGAGCDIVRFCVKDESDAKAISEIKKNCNIPLVADIHFNYKLGILSLDNGADKIRINPGNIGGENNLKELSRAVLYNGAAVRVGSNSGSVEKKYLNKFGLSDKALVESALEKVRLFEKFKVNNICISVKASSVPLMIKSYRLMAKLTDYPLHLGVTEAGGNQSGILKSAVGIGSLLVDNIGDTIRVSLTGDVVNEVLAAKRILRAAGVEKNYAEVISCPTCGRCEWDLENLALKVEEIVKDVNKPIKIAVMGCAVNGPGEAAHCDIGIAGGVDNCIIFKFGKPIKKVDKNFAEEEFIKEVKKLIK